MDGTTSNTSEVKAGWIRTRLQLDPIQKFFAGKSVPMHRHSFWYFFGGLSLFFFIVQIMTGMLLLIYYSPTPDAANESVHRIVFQVPFGWWIRSVHSWSAHLMVASVLVHMASTFFMQAYGPPREIVWMSGVILLFLVLGFAFTGYLLPWDSTAYFATQIGTEIPRSIPVLGEIIVRILRGSEFIGQETLRRLFALHVVILPVAAFFMVIFHMLMNQLHGTSIPPGIQGENRSIAFFPNYLYRDALAWSAGFLLLFWLSFMYPVNIGQKVDIYASAPPGIRPEWYFLTLFQTLRWLPGTIMGINTELLVNLGVGALGIGFLALPLIDRRSKRNERNMFIRVLGSIFVCYMMISIIVAYMTS